MRRHLSDIMCMPLFQLVFENMTESQQREGVHGEDYAAEKFTFETAVLKKFNTLLVRGRREGGFPDSVATLGSTSIPAFWRHDFVHMPRLIVTSECLAESDRGAYLSVCGDMDLRRSLLVGAYSVFAGTS